MLEEQEKGGVYIDEMASETIKRGSLRNGFHVFDSG
jgi:hypothetical protein